MLRTIALAGMLAGVLSLGSLEAQQAGKAVPPPQYEAAARQIIAARHQIPLSQLANGRSSAVDYPLTKRQAFIYTVKNGQATFLVWLDAQGQEIDAKAWAAAEQTARRAQNSQGRGPSRPAPPPAFEEVALRIGAERLRLGPDQVEVRLRYVDTMRLTARSYFTYRIRSKIDTAGVSVTLDEEGNPTTLEDANRLEMTEHRRRYGKYEPALFERLQTAGPDEVIDVLVGPAIPFERRTPSMPAYSGPGSLPREQLEAAERALDEYNAWYDDLIMRPLLAKLRATGYDRYNMQPYDLLVPLSLPAARIREMSEWSEVGGIALRHVTGFERDGGASSPPDPHLLAAALRLLAPIPQTVAERAVLRLLDVRRFSGHSERANCVELRFRSDAQLQ